MLNLYIFKFLTDDEVVSSLLRFKKTKDENDYFAAARNIILFAEHRITDGDIIKEYVLRKMLESKDLPDITRLRNFLRHDVKLIYNELLSYNWDSLFIECGYLPFSDIDTQKTECQIPGYAISLDVMLDCESNEALGGAILAHFESFKTTQLS